MVELQLQGADQDGTHLVLRDESGSEYLLPLDERLQSAVRHARVGRVAAETTGTPASVRPKDVQAMIRAGLSVDEVIADTGVERSFAERYGSPVMAERGHIVQRAQRTLVYAEKRPEQSPRPLLDLCQERLAMREVDPEAISWDAWRVADEPWTVELSFQAGDRTRTATWSFQSGALSGLDEEALWLSDGGPTDTGPIPQFGPSPERLFQVDDGQRAEQPSADDKGHRPDHAAETGRILEQLRQRRGRPQPDGGHDLEASDTSDPRRPTATRPGLLRAVEEDTTGYSTDPDRMPGAHAATPEESAEAEIFALPSRREDRDLDTQETAEEAATATSGPRRPTLDDQLSLLDDEDVSRYDTQPIDDEEMAALRTPEAPTEDTEDEKKKSRRARVPSWDEIMFGGKKD